MLSIARNVFRTHVMAPKLPLHNLEFVRTMANHRHKKIIKLAKGYRGRANRCYTVAYHRVMKARQYAYRDRKVKKREYRKLWIMRMNAATRIYGVPYNQMINGMARSQVYLNRKVLADIAMTEPLSFRSVLEVVRPNIIKPPASKKQPNALESSS